MFCVGVFGEGFVRGFCVGILAVVHLVRKVWVGLVGGFFGWGFRIGVVGEGIG